MAALPEYVYKGAHHAVLRDPKRWFEKFEGPSYAWCQTPADPFPTVEEGKRRLEHFREHGESADAFSFTHLFPGSGAYAERPPCD